MDVAELHQLVERDFDEHLTAIQASLRQESIGATGVGMAEMAQHCQAQIERFGGTVRLAEFGRYPIVYGSVDAHTDKTLLVWGKYDVMPADEPDWVVPPFSATIRDWDGLGPCVISRGAVDTKGPLQAFFNAVALLVEHEALPCNLILVLEGEGEGGSAGMAPFIDYYKEELQAAEAVIVPFCTQERDGSAAPNLGVKGLIQVELISQGGEWGGPAERDVHGGNASWLANPSWRLIHALASFVSVDEKVLIDGYAEGAYPPDEDDEALLTGLNGHFNLADQLRENGAYRFKVEGPPSEVVRHQLFDPTCNISGLTSGYTGPGFKTLVPQRATARMDLRLVPGMRPERVLSALRTHLDSHGFTDVRFEATHQYPASKVPYTNPYVQAALAMYYAHGVDTTVMPLKSGCAPLYLFSEVLQRPWVMAGLGHGGGQHSSNEYVTVHGLADFEKSMVTLLWGMSGKG